jgi:hypothetical protein
MFTAALFRVDANQKPFRYPSLGEWLNDLCYIYTLEYSLATKGGKTIATWKDLHEFQERPSEKRQLQKVTCFKISFIRLFFFLAVLGLELRASHLLGRHSTT